MPWSFRTLLVVFDPSDLTRGLPVSLFDWYRNPRSGQSLLSPLVANCWRYFARAQQKTEQSCSLEEPLLRDLIRPREDAPHHCHGAELSAHAVPSSKPMTTMIFTTSCGASASV